MSLSRAFDFLPLSPATRRLLRDVDEEWQRPRTGSARVRESYYWRVRNARLPSLAAQVPSRVWHIAGGHPGGAYAFFDPGPGELHTHLPTVLTRATEEDRDLWRGACLACAWESGTHESQGHGPGRTRAVNRAVEAAHDHSHPDWRALPVLTLAALADPRLQRQVAEQHPAGAPLLVRRTAHRCQHEPPGPRLPHYHLFVLAPGPSAPGPAQSPLF